MKLLGMKLLVESCVEFRTVSGSFQSFERASIFILSIPFQLLPKDHQEVEEYRQHHQNALKTNERSHKTRAMQ